MADTKISDLPTDIVTLADGDKFAVADASALTTNTYATALEVKTYVNTAPVYAAGSASAGTWPKFTAGTVLTTAEAGAIELDANCLYGTTDAGNRGVIPLMHIIRQDAARTLANDTNDQKLFDSVTNGRLTLETGTYFFQCQASFSVMSATSGNLSFAIKGLGSATVGTVLYHAVGIDGATATAAAQTGGTYVADASAASIVTAGTATTCQFHITGTFEVTVAGTIVPTVNLVTPVATVSVAAGTYFMCWRGGSTSLATVGQWD